ncbi:prepilin-type N-terminal cleavage/methylation domain-containing protein [Guptibacillus hwajinpoensis]|uniref:Prepilin-type N-terminal cleavage/methylation domain-containing protein n=1 Tax=Guptibacillus hwajinpoensis TaxID=208199 RepID=A0ABU0JYX2_9BACL|nr:prepilin-type N-terminal cleavage/methylation domain-containing protein [Alkalihalobacillus hemicentroti]MDQ0481421.1 prepilin-type N-terminal cleavage/methylation domain-containing protein [Alkalihalobacillus hemicentroti]
MLTNEKGFTLVEILVSLTLLTTLVLSASYFFSQSNTISSYNNQKLVAVNLARSTLERIQLEPSSYITNGIAGSPYSYQSCQTSGGSACQNYRVLINNHQYTVNVVITQDNNEKDLKLVDIQVDVSLVTSDKSIKSTVEGYIANDSILQ